MMQTREKEGNLDEKERKRERRRWKSDTYEGGRLAAPLPEGSPQDVFRYVCLAIDLSCFKKEYKHNRERESIEK